MSAPWWRAGHGRRAWGLSSGAGACTPCKCPPRCRRSWPPVLTGFRSRRSASANRSRDRQGCTLYTATGHCRTLRGDPASGLAHLQTAEFLYETSLFPELEYTFKHALTQEVAYGSLLHERRRAFHAGIVEAIEALYPDRLAEQVERLAHHALQGEVWDKALRYCRQAGQSDTPLGVPGSSGVLGAGAAAPCRTSPKVAIPCEQAIDLRLRPA